MLHFLWFGSIIGLAGLAIGGVMMRQAPPQNRYLVALTTLLIFAAAAGLTFQQQLHLARAQEEPAGQSTRFASTAPHPLDLSQTPAMARTFSRETSSPRTDKAGIAGASSWPVILDNVVALAPWIWMFGTPGMLFLFGLGWAGASRLRRDSLVMPAAWIVELSLELQKLMQIARGVTLGITDRIVSPVVIGIFTPTILLPAAVLTGYTRAQIEMVLLHELAHIRRWDGLVNILQRLMEALFFFHPLVWLVSRWARFERELCCDAVVVQHTGNAAGYAETLALFASSRAIPVLMPVLPIARHPVVHRIRRILQLQDHCAPMQGGIWTAVAGLALLLALPLWAKAKFKFEIAGAARVQMTGPTITKTRTLCFPTDRSLGFLYVTDATLIQDDQMPVRWTALGSARGTVRIAPGKRVRLSIENGAANRDLSPLTVLHPDDLDELTISGWNNDTIQGDTVLANLKTLSGLKTLNLEQLRLTPSGAAALRTLHALENLTITTPLAVPGKFAPEQIFGDDCLAVLAELNNRNYSGRLSSGA